MCVLKCQRKKYNIILKIRTKGDSCKEIFLDTGSHRPSKKSPGLPTSCIKQKIAVVSPGNGQIEIIVADVNHQVSPPLSYEKNAVVAPK